MRRAGVRSDPRAGAGGRRLDGGAQLRAGRQVAARLARIPGAAVLDNVVLDQVLVRLPGGDDPNRAAVAAVQRDGTCWLGGTTWQGKYVPRVAVSN